MSQWTHVAGIIRIDSMVDLLGGQDTTERILRDRLGYTWDFDDLGNSAKDYHIDNSYVPFGSEGSIQYDVVKTREKEGAMSSSLYWGHIVIWGDLRDFSDPHEVYDWLLNSLTTINDDGLGFRDVIVSIEVERQHQHIIFLDPEEQKLRMAKGEANIC